MHRYSNLGRLLFEPFVPNIDLFIIILEYATCSVRLLFPEIDRHVWSFIDISQYLKSKTSELLVYNRTFQINTYLSKVDYFS